MQRAMRRWTGGLVGLAVAALAMAGCAGMMAGDTMGKSDAMGKQEMMKDDKGMMKGGTGTMEKKP
ncbi:MAG: hypothetical protein HY002_17800 [Candidatus Rokubacteria bacterium]|nr:hypothetical protein [Candidatus Rokubacteria bacterium]